MILVYQIGDEPEQRRAVAHTRITIGRAPTCDVVVDREGVEREHCHLVRRNGRWFVEDRQTQSGTVVLGARPQLVLARAHPLEVGEEVLIGHHTRPRFRARFELRSDPADLAGGAGVTGDPLLPLGDAALRTEVVRLRAAVADALRDRETAVRDRDSIRDELERVRRDADCGTDTMARKLADREAEIALLTRYVVEHKQEVERVRTALATERAQHEEMRQLGRRATADLENLARLAQERAEVIEAMSGDLAMFRSRVAELEHLADNLTTENRRLHRLYAPG